jgi:hypothetical protein
MRRFAAFACARAALGLALLGGFFVPSALAEWNEGGATILTLDETLRALGVGLGTQVTTSLPGDTPVLLPMGADRENVKALRAALIYSGLALAEERGAKVATMPHAFSEAERAARRHYAIAPMAPARGARGVIDRGGALLFGRLLSPPFRVEATSDAVLINGVTVYPSPGPSAPPPVASATQEQTFAMLNTAIENYHRDRAALGKRLAGERCREALAALPGVTDAVWRGEDEIILMRTDGSEEGIVLEPHLREPDPPTFEQVAEHMDDTAEELAAVLSAGYTVVAGATYLLTVDDLGAAALRERIEVILASAEPEALILARLQARLGHRDAAADLLYAR